MAPAATQITVTAKGDFGFHPKHGLIKKGEKYTIDERDYADQLFDPPTPDYKPIWEREAEAAASPAPDLTPVPDSRSPVPAVEKGGKR